MAWHQLGAKPLFIAMMTLFLKHMHRQACRVKKLIKRFNLAGVFSSGCEWRLLAANLVSGCFGPSRKNCCRHREMQSLHNSYTAVTETHMPIAANRQMESRETSTGLDRKTGNQQGNETPAHSNDWKWQWCIKKYQVWVELLLLFFLFICFCNKWIFPHR